jgi:hypothetical protein
MKSQPGRREPFKNITTSVIVMTKLGASMHHFRTTFNNLKHYFLLRPK